MFGVALILVIVLTGGLIAFIGDRIGTRVGKRRLTLWGLRPRYTSIIITILTGILIAGSTIGVLTVTSYDVRTALFGMEALKKQTRELASEVEARTKALNTAQQELTKARAEIEKTNAEYAATNERLSAITQELRALQASKQALDERIASLNAAKAELQQDVDRLNELTANLRRGIATVREGTIVLRAGEVIAVNVVQGGGSRTDVERRLTDYMKLANQRLRDRFQIDDEKLDLIFIGKTHAEEVINFMTARPEPMVLRLLSASNVVVGEPVIGQFEIFPNRLIFEKGAMVLRDRVTYSGDPAEAEQIMAIFLRRVNETAVKQGVIPDPLQGTVGNLSAQSYYEAVNQLRRLKGEVEIAAVTRTEVSSIGPLTIDILIRPIVVTP
jgi:uncharacterized protein (DUF3084 family)